jgi:MinD superfamily P-loop ATPase
MPWINPEPCTGCGVCETNCPAGAIKIHEQKAELNQKACIRCGICHSVCPRDAVRHDSELIPEEVKANAEWIATLLAHPHYAENHKKQKQLLERLKKHFNKTIQVAQQTLEEILSTSP